MVITEKKFQLLYAVVYFIVWIFLCLYFFVENDEGAPIKDILELHNLVPIVIYTAIPIWLSYFLFLLFKKIVHKSISFCISIVIGIPAGIVLDSTLAQIVIG